ncbi:pyridoxamine 5'-phosphate oxidase family protein [Streptomyces sp. NRRL B-24085]|uniref:pyridoxamine 5'-phosphate oxidase family protein n=1 Tax=Streptomyces sp. NRRL B-24085 TaxID=1709476 RepID=UPI0006B37E80|nr:pyridoxamine 5'-phosphate oxidase family protein [Streptomyces sp. NRRL B-24085]
MRPTAENARGIVDANRYLVLATADAEGRPWSTPVYFAHVGCREFFWVSSPDAVHSRNIAVRPQVGIAVFDSSVEIGTGQGVYASAVAAELVDGAEEALEVFSRRSLGHGGRVWTLDDVRGDSGMRLYRAVAGTHSMLAKDGRPDHRVTVDLA